MDKYYCQFGISFYTFHGLSYVIDIYYKRFKSTYNFVEYSLFVSFFPLFVADPIERANHLLPQVQTKRKFYYNLFIEEISQMIWGFFKKAVIADRVAVVVNQAYGSPDKYGNYNLIIATVFFAIQIYCDFSGYSDIAIGAGKTMGFRLLKNFNIPYFSKSLNEFWKKQHISLTSWFRDYLYIPLGGNRRGEIRTYLNIFIVFVVSWLWHGAAFTFIIWRAIHSLILMIERFLKPYLWLGKVKNDPIFRFSIVVFTFTIVCVESKKFYSKVNLNLTNEISIKNVRIEKTNYSMCQITIGFDTKENVNSLGDYKLAVHAYLVSGNEGYLAEVNKKRNRKYDLTDIQLDYSDSIQFNFQTKINEFKNIEFFLFNSKGFDGVIGNTVKIRSSMKKEE